MKHHAKTLSRSGRSAALALLATVGATLGWSGCTGYVRSQRELELDVPASTVGFSVAKWLDDSGRGTISVEGTFGARALYAEGPLLSPKDLELHETFLDIDVSSLMTGVELRDDRLKQLVFRVAQYATATVKLGRARVESDGDRARVTAPAWLRLLGTEQPLGDVKLFAHRQSDGSWMVTSERPILVRASRFSLDLAALKPLCGLKGMNDEVSVAVTLRLVPGAPEPLELAKHH